LNLSLTLELVLLLLLYKLCNLSSKSN